jgi:uncharacterized membrane protein
MKSSKLVNWINKLDAHYRLYLSVGAAIVVFLIISKLYPAPIYIMAAWLAFAGTNLLLSWITILTSHPIEVKKGAKIQDSNRSLIFLIVVAASLISLFAVILLLKSSKQDPLSSITFHTLLSIVSVIFAWWLVHTIFAFRYAHLFYNSIGAEGENKRFVEGLEFPKEKEPDYLDFTYFSFVIGMTFQVSDVEISSRRIRRLALMHAVVSFIFNTVILALSINVILGIIQK